MNFSFDIFFLDFMFFSNYFQHFLEDSRFRSQMSFFFVRPLIETCLFIALKVAYLEFYRTF